jgi:lipoyl(octanoyl) transferase
VDQPPDASDGLGPAEPTASGSGLPPAPSWRWLGRIAFAETCALQERLRAAILSEGGGETLLLLEHDPVITLGRAGATANVLVSADELARRGVTLHRASRGGDVTYHGPGQLVGYPVVRLRRGVRAHIEAMAAALAEVLLECGVTAHYRKDAPGLWVRAGASEAEKKICAFGINVHRRVAVHGFALNLDPPLAAFSLIVPCGLVGSAVTSVRDATGRTAPTPEALAPRVAAALGRHLGLEFVHARAPGREPGELRHDV